MSLLRFDPAGSIDAGFGITPAALGALAQPLTALRTQLVQEAADGSSEDGFFQLPAQQLDQYEKHRERSELGRIFQVANGMHDDIDAVVVLGSGGSTMTAQALMAACCDPYHNELTRGGRGSKPRMYFAGDSLDNDAAAALLHRLAAGGYGDTPAEARWALVVVSKSGQTLETAVALRQFVAALRRSLPDQSLLGRLLLPITGPSGPLRQVAGQLGCQQIFDVPADVSGQFSGLSAVGLLPAAMLGLDCIQLLGGAAAINDHFATAPFADNAVLQYVAVNRLLAQESGNQHSGDQHHSNQHRGKTIRVLSVADEALETVGHWYDHLVAAALGSAAAGGTVLTHVHTRDLHGRHPQHQAGGDDKVFHQLVVRQHRSDALAVGHNGPAGDGRSLNDGLGVLADHTLPQLMATAVPAAARALRQAGRPTTQIVLPHIDTFTMGQLLQFFMIATVIEARWLRINPFGQPAVQAFKADLNQHLGWQPPVSDLALPDSSGSA